MQLNNSHKKQLLFLYFACFAVTYLWLICHGFLLSQLQPVFFVNKLDFSRNLLMLTDIQHAVIKYQWLQVGMDALYLLFPVTLLFAHLKNSKVQYSIALLCALFNFVYAMQVTAMSTLSIEGYISWMLIPLMFAANSARFFYFMLQLVRYLFILIFVSAGLWKIRTGAIFNTEQMAGILLKQHAGYLWSSPGNWFSQCITYLAEHPFVSWLIYLGATGIELFFVVGFFTKKYDLLLILLFILFLLTNFFLMRINYISWFIFTGCVWFARYTEPQDKTQKLKFATHTQQG